MKIIVSGIYVVSQHGFKRLEAEKAFTDYKKALEFLNLELFEDNSNQKDCLAEIVEYELVNNEVLISRTIFDGMGEFYDTSNNDKVKSPNFNKNFVPTFKVGDVVVIKCEDDTDCSFFNHTPGVVTAIPLEYKEWKRKFNLSDNTWEPLYKVEFVGETGFLSHCHPREQDIQLLDKNLPSELMVLEKLSGHFKNEKRISNSILNSLRIGEVYALNRKTIKDIDWEH